jgi:flagellar biosynthetic protein FlhB
MADKGQRSEKPTQRRIDRARREGNFPVSREFVSAIQFLGFVTLLVTFAGVLLARAMRVTRYLLARAFSGDVTAADLTALVRWVIAPELTPLVVGGGILVALTVLTQLATTKMGISLTKIKPDVKRLSFAAKIKNLPGQNLPVFVQAVLLLPVVGLVVYYEAAENLDSFLELPWMAAQSAAVRVGGTIETLLWRAAGLFLVVGAAELFWQRHRYRNQLRMSKQEIREEAKEQEGSPQTKMRIRRLQRDLTRRQMMKEVQKATAVIVNPTHYAVAIRYSMNSSAAPRVVAKGKNYLAARIRQRAIEKQVPIVENPPLAQALYKSVDVGQEIPSHLYRAVAEILAYIYRLMNGHLPG